MEEFKKVLIDYDELQYLKEVKRSWDELNVANAVVIGGADMEIYEELKELKKVPEWEAFKQIYKKLLADYNKGLRSAISGDTPSLPKEVSEYAKQTGQYFRRFSNKIWITVPLIVVEKDGGH